MSAVELLRSLFRYQAWANKELLAVMAGLDPDRHGAERHTAIRRINHAYVVNRIFAAHLIGKPHGFAADNTPETPDLEDLRADLAASDRWYLDYLDAATPALLSGFVSFAFTDGDQGGMTRQEMLTHVVTHGGYHRGEVRQILTQLPTGSAPGLPLLWDTYAVHLHRAEPSRRVQAGAAAAVG